MPQSKISDTQYHRPFGEFERSNIESLKKRSLLIGGALNLTIYIDTTLHVSFDFLPDHKYLDGIHPYIE